MEQVNKTALITGAAKGIGKAVALAFAKEGYNIVINYNGSKEAALNTQQEIEALGVKTLVVQADVSDEDQVKTMVEKSIETFERIDVLVNNSGINKDGLMLRMSYEDFHKVIAVNLEGTFNCIKHVSRIMMKQRSGSIINMSSVVGIMGNAGQANYASSKAGVLGLTKSAARELALRHIRVNAIAPGFIETDMTAKLAEKDKAKMMEQIPLRQFGQPEDVANVCVALASDAFKYVTGQTIHVDGGMVQKAVDRIILVPQLADQLLHFFVHIHHIVVLHPLIAVLKSPKGQDKRQELFKDQPLPRMEIHFFIFWKMNPPQGKIILRQPVFQTDLFRQRLL